MSSNETHALLSGQPSPLVPSPLLNVYVSLPAPKPSSLTMEVTATWVLVTCPPVASTASTWKFPSLLPKNSVPLGDSVPLGARTGEVALGRGYGLAVTTAAPKAGMRVYECVSYALDSLCLPVSLRSCTA